MSWVRWDDAGFDHPKMLRASGAQKAVHWSAMTYAAQQLTDGHIPAHVIPLVVLKADPTYVPDAEELVAGLVKIGLWDEDPGGDGYWVHDYLEYNPSREDVLRRKEQAREAGRLGGLAASAAKQAVEEDAHLPDSQNAKRDGKQSAERSAKRTAQAKGDGPGRDGTGKEKRKDDSKADIPDGFAAFYDTCPRRERRHDAEKAWRDLRKRRPDVTPDMLRVAAGNYAESVRGVERRYVLQPANFLSRDAWEDHLTPSANGARAGPSPNTSRTIGPDEQRRRELAEWAAQEP